MPETESVDALFVHCGQLVTLADGAPRGPRIGAALEQLGIVEDGAVAARDGRIVAVGRTDDLGRRYRAEREYDLSGMLVMPGFVDAHTHPVFAATRQDEFHMRCQGADYMEIAAAGGGILSSVAALRAAGDAELRERVERNFDGFLAQGTTTIEGKSGYGLDTRSEVRSLEILRDVADEHPLTVHPTFLGAHEVPMEFRDDPDRYVDLVVEEMLPAVEGLCRSCDVFAEPRVFDAARSERVLEAARARGMRLRVHADEIEPMGGAELAVRLGADSADHLAKVSAEGIRALAGSGGRTTAMLLPGTSFYLGKSAHAPARAMLEAGCAVALATDFNPGSCHTQSMPLVITLACVLLHMKPEECIAATTINPAASLGLDEEVGTLHVGKRCDLVVLDLPDWKSLGYAFGGNPAVMTVKNGRAACLNVRELGGDL